MAQADLLIADRCGMTLEAVEALDDEHFVELLARARWLEEREVERIEAGLLAALSRLFRR